MHRTRPTRIPASRSRLFLVSGGLAAAAALALLPPQWAEVAKAPAVAATAPVQGGLLSLRRAAGRTVLKIQARWRAVEARADRVVKNRRLAEENRRLRAELRAARDQVRLFCERKSEGSALLAAECVPARILGRPAQSYLRRQRLLDLGSSHGAQTGSLVLQTPVIDRGSNAGIREGDAVLTGSRVWGKISSAGLHTSVVVPITESGYRDLVRLATASPDGGSMRFGARGILEGTGESLARLRMVETTEPVAEGDLVCSMAGRGFADVPLPCGRVVRVERPDGAGHWELWVAPLVEETPEVVAVLRPTDRPIELARRETTTNASRHSE